MSSPITSQNVTTVVMEKPTKGAKAVKAVKASNESKVTAPVKEVVVDTAPPKEKKPRTPTLLAKYSKFIQFAFFLLQELKDQDGNVAVDSEEDFLEKIHLYDTVENQQAFVQGFLDESKDIAKTVRKMNVDKKRAEVKAAKAAAKPPKAPKEPNAAKEPKEPKAAKAKKTDTVVAAEEVLQPAVAAKQPKGKAKKADVDPFVTELVNLATNTEAAPAKAEKPKRKYNKKVAEVAEVVEAVAEAEAELDVSVFEYEGKQYLQDDTGRVFDAESHELIGKLVDGKVVLN